MYPRLAKRSEHRLETVFFLTGVDPGEVVCSFAQSLADRKLQLVVVGPFNAGDDINRLEDVEDNVVLVGYRDGRDIVFHHLLNYIQDRVRHASGDQIRIRAQTDVSDRFFQ